MDHPGRAEMTLYFISGSLAAGVTLNGGESGGNPALSADAVAFCLRMLVSLPSCG